MRKLIALPRLAKSTIERAEPILVNDLIEKQLPQLTKLATEIMLPVAKTHFLSLLTTEKLDPNLVNCRRLIMEPQCT
jgi:hypothetical protein